VVDLINWIAGHGKNVSAASRAAAQGRGVGSAGQQHGGPVMAGMSYTVGEAGPETLVMGPRAGYVIPNAGGGGGATAIHIHIGTFYGDGPGLDRLTMAIAQRLSYATGR